MIPQTKMPQLWLLWALEARIHRSRTRLEPGLSPEQIQRPAPSQYRRASQVSGRGLWLKVGEKMVTTETQEKHVLLFLYFDSFCSWFWIFPSAFSVSVVVALLFLFRLLRTFLNHTLFSFIYFHVDFLWFCVFLGVFCSCFHFLSFILFFFF